MGIPWTVYGQTAPNPTTDAEVNPTPNYNNGDIIGEVQSLPYTVPVGYNLVIFHAIIEKYNVGGTVVMAPFIGDTPPTSNNQFLFSVSADGHSNQWSGRKVLKPGTKFNVKIMDLEPEVNGVHQVLGWSIDGELVPI